MVSTGKVFSWVETNILQRIPSNFKEYFQIHPGSLAKPGKKLQSQKETSRPIIHFQIFSGYFETSGVKCLEFVRFFFGGTFSFGTHGHRRRHLCLSMLFCPDWKVAVPQRSKGEENELPDSDI